MSTINLVLDLCSGGGVIAESFNDSIGIDSSRKKLEYYPNHKILADATKAPIRSNSFYFGHGSPPCQLFNNRSNKKNHRNIVDEVRLELLRIAKFHSIENIPASPIRKDLMLCHSMFDLPGARHRHFELNFHVDQPKCRKHNHIYTKDGVPNFAFTKGSRTRNIRFLGCRDLPADISGEGVPPKFMDYIQDQLINPRQHPLEAFNFV